MAGFDVNVGIDGGDEESDDESDFLGLRGVFRDALSAIALRPRRVY